MTTAAEAGKPDGTACQLLADAPKAAFPLIASGCGGEIRYSGAYFADGKFRTGAIASANAQEHAKWRVGSTPLLRPGEVPPNVDMHPREQVRENLEAGRVAEKAAHPHSGVVELRDDIVTLAYGHEQNLLAPTYVTADRDGRVIVSDPGAMSVHVLDAAQPYRILAGPQYRLQHVGAVTTDAARNIYVADPVVGIVVEFDRDGRYLGEIGKLGEGEGIFHEPVAIAVDVHRFLFVADAERDMVLVVNGEGKILQRMGGRRNEMGVSLRRPSALVLKRDRLYVMDDSGRRIQVFDLRLRLMATIATGLDAAAFEVDRAGNLYASGGRSPRISVFDPAGRKQGEFGKSGSERGEIGWARGLWIDDGDRLYVADSENRRVEVMEIRGTEGGGR